MAKTVYLSEQGDDKNDGLLRDALARFGQRHRGNQSRQQRVEAVRDHSAVTYENAGPEIKEAPLARYRSAKYEILVDNSGGVGRGIAFAQLDDTVIGERPLRVSLADDGPTHRLRVRLV